ncbi:MAG: NAD(P)-dependent oxidoreductase [Eubacteriales bacterium]|nr:NAD(P)-dependent oxidoreductase [Eubacteriales bacterium]
MKIVLLDKSTLGEGLDFSAFKQFGDVELYDITPPSQITERILDADVVVVNKVNLNATNLADVKNLKLICAFATGYDNIDVEYCKSRGIAVTNVVGYSTYSVAQLTITMALHLTSHIPEYTRFVESGDYTKSGIQNRLIPLYHELYGKTWGIIGLGNIGRQVARCAEALGCNIIAYTKTPNPKYTCVDLDTLCKEADIISIHTPLTPETTKLINSEKLAIMKKSAIIINVARGAVADEEALANAIKDEKISGIGVDVYSTEPFPASHPYNEIAHLDNVCLTPHMAWGALEARVRCLEEIIKNITAYTNGEERCRVDK